MATKRTINHPDRIIKALLTLTAKRGWSVLTIQDVAKAAKIPAKEFEKLVPDKAALLVMLGRYIDDLSLAVDIDVGQPPKDRVFEALMNRFDVLQDHRDGIVPILRDIHKNPCDVVTSLPHLASAMGQIFTQTNLEVSGWMGALRLLGLSAVYLSTLRVWMDDDSDDLTKTMAALDTALQRAERIAEWLTP